MNKEVERPVTHLIMRRTTSGVLLRSLLGVSLMGALLALSACTTYRPVGQGSTVPWAKALAAELGGPIGDNRYRVGEGDALSRIAERYDVRLAALATANNIAPPYVLYPGEVLRIPANVPAPVERPTPPPAPAIVQSALPPEPIGTTTARRPEPRPSPPVAESGKRYVVGKGESLSAIAAQHGLRLGELVAANGIASPYRIRPGQSLIIPPTEAGRSQHVAAKPSGDLVAIAPPPPLSADGFLWPVQGNVIGSFEENSDRGRSGGINIAARKGTPVRAADNGIVAYAGEALRGYGQMIMLRHAEGYVTLYAHNDALLVREGDVVERGQTIAEVGNSGDVIESQLHFELRKGTRPVDPTEILAGLPGRVIGKL